MNENMMFIIENKMVMNGLQDIHNCSFISLSSENYCETYEFDISELESISYVFNPYVVNNLQQQTQKNIDLINQFKDKSITFCLNFNETKYQYSL